MRCGLLLAALVKLALSDLPILHDYQAYQDGAYGVKPNQTFYSSNITAPLFNYNTWKKGLVAGDESYHVLIGLDYNGAGPYLFRNDDLSLVYANPSFGTVMNARVQTIRGVRYLSFWHGEKSGSQGKGYCVFYDRNYELKFNVTVAPPLTVHADIHECEAIDTGSVLLTAYQDKEFDLSSIGYTEQAILADSCFQEVDIASNELMFSWCASDHFDIEMTYLNFTNLKHLKREDKTAGFASPADGVDVYHINSLQKTIEGHYLVSFRPLKLIAYINGVTGKPIWHLGGKLNDFTDITPSSVLASNLGSDGALSFGWQHHVRFRDEGMTQITLFDNHNASSASTGECTDSTCSRGRYLQIDASDANNLTVQLVRDYYSPQRLSSYVKGSMQPIPAFFDPAVSKIGNVLLGWGSDAEFSEYTADGEVVRDIQFSPFDTPGTDGSYRVYKSIWHAYPAWPPSIATDGDGTLYVSWNGATEVRGWAVYGTESEDLLGVSEGLGYGRSAQHSRLEHLQPLNSVERAGFETGIVVGDTVPAFAKVAALDGGGRIIGHTATVQLHERGFSCGLDCLVLETNLLP